MTAPDRFAAISRGLADGVRAHEALTGLVLLGSAAEDAADRRDEWSDHDFFAIIAVGRGAEVRPDLSWLPDQDRLVLTAREGEIGFVAVYDDGHVLEFALSEAPELAGAVAGDATVVVDDAGGSAAELIARARERAASADRFDPVNDARLVLVKLLIGVGRARRGEVLVAGQFVRIWAVQHLVRGHPRTLLRGVEQPARRDRPGAALRARLPRVGRTHRGRTRGAGGGCRARAVHLPPRGARAGLGGVPLERRRRRSLPTRLGVTWAAGLSTVT